MRRLSLSLTAVVLGFATVRAADDAVTFKLARPKPGDRVRVSQSDKTKRTLTTTDAKGKKSVAAEQASSAWVYVGEIIEPKAKDNPPKVTRTYEKYQVTKNGKAEAGPPLNVPITIEKFGEKFVYSAGKRPLPAAFVARLDEEFNAPLNAGPKPEDMLPSTAVKPGDTWKVDPLKAFQGTGKLALDAEKGSMTGKFVKTYRKADRQFATMEFVSEAPIKSLGPDSGLTLKEGSVASLMLTVDACIDGTDPYSRTTGRVTFRVEGEGKGGTVVMIAETVKSETIELLPPKK
jgi:hypothetical protein